MLFSTKHCQVRVLASGGLGNQLYQLACGVSLANRFGGVAAIDTTWYKVQRYKPRRTFELLNVSPGSSPCVSTQYRMLRANLCGFAWLTVGRYPKTSSLLQSLTSTLRIKEHDPHKADSRLYESHTPRKIVLDGYWQTRDHFLNASAFLQRLQPAFPLSSDYHQYLARIQRGHSAFVHVRRGDFAKWPESMMSADFYRAASSRVSSELGATPGWFVFSEEQEWCRANLPFLKNATFVQLDSPHKDIEEVFLMKACGAGIIPNSSFSWWGAALGDRPGRPVVASKYRHGKKSGAVQAERLLGHWIQIEEF